jgi:hypothetical protein
VLLDVQFQGATTSLVVVPDADFPAIAGALEKYGFYSEDKLSLKFNEIALSLRLRGYPQGIDKLLYLKK